jgi:signal transduction histidine kinase
MNDKAFREMGLLRKYLKHIHFELSRKLLSESNKYDQIRNINLLTILLLYIIIGLVVIIIFTVQDFLTLDYKHFFLIDIPAFIIFPLMLFILLTKRKIKLVSHFFTLFLAFVIMTIFFTGAGYLTGPVYYIVFPLITMFLLGWRTGFMYSLVLLILLVLIYIIFHKYSWFPDYNLQVFFRYFIIIFMAISATLLYENMIQRYHLSNIKLIDRIRGKNQKLSLKANELRVANEKLLDANEELERITKETDDLNKSLNSLIVQKDKFFSIISHDLKNPINILDGFANLLNDHYELYNEDKRRKYLRIIRDSSNSLKNLIEGLLEWSRIQSESFKYFPTEINLFQLIEMVLDSAKSQALQKGINLTSKININTTIYADFQMMYSVFRNLVSNAVKFTHTSGVVMVHDVDEDNFVKIQIEDNGLGIREENISKLFHIDTSFSTHGTNNETGTGLGLVLCKEFVEKNGGTIGVESKPGIGSTFWVKLSKPN